METRTVLHTGAAEGSADGEPVGSGFPLMNWPTPRSKPTPHEGRTRTTAGFVYFIQQGKDGPIKIGWALNPMRRMGELQMGNPIRLRLIGQRAGTALDEAANP